MTHNEARVLRYMSLQDKGIVSWYDLRKQLCLTAGALTVYINALMLLLFVQRDGLYYRITQAGRDALELFENPPRRKPFANAPEW